MSTIHYFQRYTQKENVTTNNTLLLCSRLQQLSPPKFKMFINELVDNLPITVGVQFSQQLRNKKSVPDGMIHQESFKIVIETKIIGGFTVAQLQNHLHAFKSEDTQILLALGKHRLDKQKQEQLNTIIRNYNSKQSTNVVLITITFKEIISMLRSLIQEFETELQDLVDDYEDFCRSSHLIQKASSRLLVVPCGYTLNDNLKNHVYYDPQDRGYSYCTHLGIYTQKMMRAIGKIDNIVTAHLNDQEELIVTHTSKSEATSSQKARIIQIIKDAQQNLGWDITNGHKFFCVEAFIPCQFKKSSPYGLFGKKYFNLNTFLGKEKFENTQEITILLNEKSW